MSDPLRPAALLQSMSDALPTQPKDDTTSALSSSYESLALFAHACMTNLSFRLLGFHEESKAGSSASSPSREECSRLAPRLPASWNASFNSHSFVYAHPQSSMTFVIRIDRLGTKAEIRGLGVGDERIYRMEITARDFISSAALPLRIPRTQEGEEGGGGKQEEEDRSGLPDKLGRVFLSPERLSDLAVMFKTRIVQKLVPGLSKEGYEESPDDRAAREDAEDAGRTGRGSRQPPAPSMPGEPARPYPFDDPLAAPPRNPRPLPAGDFPPPGFEDEYEVNRPRGGVPALGGMPGRSPFNIGHDDLNPPGLGPHDPLRGSFVGGGGGLPRPGGGGGMHPTLDDPLFGGPRGAGGGGGGEGFDPQAPPGARWDDPMGRGGPRFGEGRPGNGRGGGGFGGFGGGFGGDII